MTFSKLGTDTETHQTVYLPKSARVQGLYIIGMQRMGKSGLFEELILQDINQQIGVCVLDPHGELIDHVLARLPGKAEDKVIFLDIKDEDHPFGLNLFACDNPKSAVAVQYVVDQVRHIFEKLLGVSAETPLILEYLVNCTHTLIANPGYTMADIPLLLTDKNCRQQLVTNVTDFDVRLFWQHYEQMKPSEQLEQIASLRRRIREFLQPLTRPIVGQAQTTIDFRRIMDDRKILLVKLNRQLDAITSLIGSIIVALILNASDARQTKNPFHLYADEFQNFATEDFAVLLEQAGKRNIGVSMAHQNRSQLELSEKQADKKLKDRTLNVGSLVVFRVPTDADELAGQFDITPQAAWEEELEEEWEEEIAKEWVEVLEEEWEEEVEKEWHERIEEEIEDGVDEIKTPVTNPIRQLYSSGGHKNPAVQRFISTHPLADLERADSTYKEAFNELNRVVYRAMIEGRLSSPISFRSTVLLHGSLDRYLWPISYYARDLYWSDMGGSLWENLWIQPRGQFDRAWREFEQEAVAQAMRRCQEQFPKELARFVKELKSIVQSYNSYDYGSQRPDPPGFLEYYSKEYFPWADLDTVLEISHHVRGEPFYKVQEKPIGNLYSTSTLQAYITQKVNEARPYVQQLRDFVLELRNFIEALAIEPITSGSGLHQPRTRTQITYLTHPRKTLSHPRHTITHPRKTISHPRVAITHPQRTYQDVKTDIANQLVHLQKYTARVKIAENIPQNPGKKCMKCGLLNTVGALKCRQCKAQLPAPNEYIITTFEPEQGLYGKALQERIARILSNNIRDRYFKKRADVEAEIIKRQTRCSGSAPVQPQQPQPRHTRQVPVQGSCPNCRASNAPGSQFCNQCGTKL